MKALRLNQIRILILYGLLKKGELAAASAAIIPASGRLSCFLSLLLPLLGFFVLIPFPFLFSSALLRTNQDQQTN